MAAVTELRTEADRQRGLPVMRDLFPHLTAEQYRSFFEDDHLFARTLSGEIVGLAGVSVRSVLHRERHVWVHDLVVAHPHRGEGHGRLLLDHVEAWARAQGCDLVALATGADRDVARLFYESRATRSGGRCTNDGSESTTRRRRTRSASRRSRRGRPVPPSARGR
ncbi:GNAT family N-acetyltransferase [Halomarina litorea]|uniref:GNAT family N-acetyltransferase n=1 Tax=Halomarina litorea TaxID=2961595 RepID=UPI0020C266AE|nr:GNAT family N-acetyltransferase [Halomarina sp. BCD28]